MLEAQAHQQLKTLLQRDGGAWPHQLTLSRLIGRSLRRQDKTLIRLSPDSRIAGGSGCSCHCACSPAAAFWC